MNSPTNSVRTPKIDRLRKVLEIVKPRTVYVFAIPPAEEKAGDFLNRLAGLCKYVLNQQSGKTTVHELTAAMASRESAIQIALLRLGLCPLLQKRRTEDNREHNRTERE